MIVCICWNCYLLKTSPKSQIQAGKLESFGTDWISKLNSRLTCSFRRFEEFYFWSAKKRNIFVCPSVHVFSTKSNLFLTVAHSFLLYSLSCDCMVLYTSVTSCTLPSLFMMLVQKIAALHWLCWNPNTRNTSLSFVSQHARQSFRVHALNDVSAECDLPWLV